MLVDHAMDGQYIQNELAFCREVLLQIANAKGIGTAIPLAGSATAANDAAIQTLSRDSLVAQRIATSFQVQGCDGLVDGGVERFGIGECLVGEMMGFEIVPDDLDIVEFGRVFRQPFNGEPMLPGGKCCQRCLAGMACLKISRPAVSCF